MRFILPLLLLFSYSVYSQQPACSCKFQGILSAGLAAGESSVKPIVQLSGGLMMGRFFSGLGGGFDFYRFQSIPVFVDGRYYVGKSQSAFIYTNTGYNIATENVESDPGWESPFLVSDKYTGGFYLDAGIGYRLDGIKSTRILISAGFSHKRMNQVTTYNYPCPIAPCPDQVTRYQYNLGRITAKLSWEFSSGKR